MEQNTIKLPNGRVLGLASFGDPRGLPCLYFHGWPGSRLEAALFHDVAFQIGVRLIAVDRPGVGLSSFQRNRCLADWPADIDSVVSSLGLQRFAFLGYSAGAPYAIACAAHFAGRVVSTTLVAGLGPLDQPAERRLMPSQTRLALFLSHLPRWLIAPLCRLIVGLIRSSPGRLFSRVFLAGLSESDRSVLAASHVRHHYHRSVMEAFRAGSRGVARDGYLLHQPWRIATRAIQSPVFLWHGEEDREVPMAMGRFLTSLLPGVQPRLLKGEGHFSLPVRHQAPILEDVKRAFTDHPQPTPLT